MLYDAAGFALALGRASEPPSLPPFFHFGRAAASPEDVRALRERLDADGVPVVEWDDEPEYVSVKFTDPDGHVVQVAWEPDVA